MKKNFLKSVAAAAMAGVMAIATAVPVFAEATNLHITIKNAEGLPGMVAGQFSAYQIFKGDYAPDSDASDSRLNEWGATSWPNATLSNIQWGAGIKDDGSTLVAALTSADKATWPEFYSSDTNYFQSVASASDVANVLSGKDNGLISTDRATYNAFLQAFAKFLVLGADRASAGDDGFLSTTKVDSTVTDGGSDAEDKSDIDLSGIEEGHGHGYYLVVDNKSAAGSVNGVVSEYILAVVGSQEINLKGSVPTVDKEILKGDNETKDDPTDDDESKGDSAGVGDTVHFKLTGTVAQNFMDYKTYAYTFEDTLSKGLSVKEDTVKVVMYMPDSHFWTWPSVFESGTDYEVTKSIDDVGGGDKLTIKFTDLKQAIIDAFQDHVDNGDWQKSPVEALNDYSTLASYIQIVVTYDATIDSDAVIGSAGNSNKVTLKYSNDPNNEEDGEPGGDTPEEETKVYVFGLDLKKVGEGNDASGLEGAGFIVLNEQKDKIAKFKTGEEQPRMIESWEDYPGTFQGLLQAYQEAINTDADATSAKEAMKDYICYSQAGEGKIGINGLGDGKFYLSEVVTPEGYNTIPDIDFTITAVVDTEAGTLTSLSGASESTAVTGEEMTYTSGTNDGELTAGLLPGTVKNEKAPVLPFTGGIGAGVVYAVSALVLVAGAAFVFFATRKKKDGAEQ